MLSPTIDWSVARAEFTEIVTEYRESGEAPEDFPASVHFADIINAKLGDGDHEELLEKAQRYAERLSIDSASSPTGHAFINGKHFDLDDVCPGSAEPSRNR